MGVFFVSSPMFSSLRGATRLFQRTTLSFSQGASPSLLGVSQRFYASTVFDRSKPHLNVGTIGHVDHGKTTLTAAITKILADQGMANTKFTAYEEIDKAPEEKKRGITIAASHVEYETPAKHYSHVDCPGHQEFIKNMISGAASLDVAILVVDGAAGVMPQTREHLLLAKQVGVPQVVVWVNKCDMIDEVEILEIVEMDVKDVLALHSFDPNKVKFIRGSALQAIEGDKGEYGVSAVEKLIDVLDNDLAPPNRDFDKPFLMGIKEAFSVGGRGTVATGTVVQGSVKVGDALEIVGMSKTVKPLKTACTGIEMFNKSLERGEPGDNCGILLRGIKEDQIRRGQVLCQPGTVAPKTHIKGSVYLLTEEEGGRKKGFKTGYRPQFFFRSADVTGSVTLPSDVEIAVPGDNLEIESKLILPIAINKGDAFSIREGGKTVGHGIVSEVIG